MRIEATRDCERIEAFLRWNAPAHVYAIADLDDPHWPHTRWYGASADGELVGLCMLLDAPTMPILYAVCPANHAPTRALLRAIQDELPERFFYNLGPGLEGALGDWQLAPEGRYWKMVLRDPGPAGPAIGAGIGNLVTRPEARGRGLGGRVAAAVVSGLRPSADTIGLNVHEANLPARRCYERLGFEPVCPYDEGVAVRRSRAS